MKKTKKQFKKCFFRVSLAVLAAFTFAITTVQAIPITVAGFPISSFTGGIAGFTSSIDSFRPAQTFTALNSGDLAGISVALAQNGPTLPANVIVEFRQTLAGVPTSTVLASAMINGSLLSGVQPGSPVMLTADFSADNIWLKAGSIYSFSLRIGGQGAADACGSGAYIAYPYSGGSLFASSDSGATWGAQSLYDMNFKVTATVPDESCTMTLLLLSMLALFALKIYTRKGEGMLLTRRRSQPPLALAFRCRGSRHEPAVAQHSTLAV
jgi:hypothetical protein